MTEKKSKVCSKCKQEKLLCDFDKYVSQCKKCKKEYNSKYYQENSEKIKESGKKYRQKNLEKIKERNAKYRRENPEKIKERNAKYYQKNSEKAKEYQAKYYQKNSEKIKECKAKYYQENPEKMKERHAKYRRENPEKKNAYFRKRYKNDENFRIEKLLRNRLWYALKSQSAKKSKSAQELAGCSRDELWEHLEKQFKDGMIRQNLGKWHVDHIKPCSLFDLTDPEQQKECFNYKNLQPLWAEENLSKGAKW